MKANWILCLLMLVTVACSHSKKQSKESYTNAISFEEDGKEHKTQVLLPSSFKERRPLVVVVHEWWGRNAYIEKRTRMLNSEGFASVAVDLYGDNKVVETPKEATGLATPFYQNPEMGVARLKKFIEQAKKDPHVDPSRIYVIGFCFGGTQALNLARSGADVEGVVVFHGGLASTLPAKDIKARVLVLNGAADPMVPAKDVTAFEEEMKKTKVDYKVVNYPGATHAFTNPNATAVGKKFNIPISYNKEAEQKAWNEMLTFIRQK